MIMTTRNKKIIIAKGQGTTTATNKRIESSWVLMLKESVLYNASFNIITLPHPADGKPVEYCLDGTNKCIYEVVTFKEPYRSWFIGETVKSDGSLLLLTPVNPLFLVLPRLKEQCSNRAVPLEDLLSEKRYSKIVDFVNNLDLVGDLKGPPDIKAYKYNQDKTLNWLESRVRKLSKVLREKNIHVTSGAVSATFVASSVNSSDVDEEFYLKYAYGMVSEYLPEDLVEQLEKRFNFKPELIEAIGKKRKSEVSNIDANKKMKLDNDMKTHVENIICSPDFSFSEEKKPKQLSAKEKARQKAASGTKTISSFFIKK